MTYRTDGKRPRITRRRVVIGALVVVAGWLAMVIFGHFFGTWIRFHGQVVDENGQPVPNALVHYTVWRQHGKLTLDPPALFAPSRESTSRHFSLVTDASGKFHINGLGDALKIDKIEATDHIPTSNSGGFDYRSGRPSPPFSPDRAHPVAFVLKNLPPFIFYGRVVDEFGVSVAGAQVVPTFGRPERSPGVLGAAVETNDKGEFIISGRGDISMFDITKAGFAAYKRPCGYGVAPYVPKGYPGSDSQHPAIFVLYLPTGHKQ